jgi:hypothetical protein
MRRKIEMPEIPTSSDFAKGPVVVLGPRDGESFWQPLPSVGYIVNKLTPYNSPYDNFAMGLQVLEPGAHIRRHAHERQHEVLFCYEGTGIAEVGYRRRADAHAVDDLAGRARGLVSRHRPPAAAGRADPRAVRTANRHRGYSGPPALRPVRGRVRRWRACLVPPAPSIDPPALPPGHAGDCRDPRLLFSSQRSKS